MIHNTQYGKLLLGGLSSISYWDHVRLAAYHSSAWLLPFGAFCF